ncbi:PTS transporter subunit EIIC [Ligilactobacillus sp. Marseille-Q7487]|uniref:PTS sugar transporter subunit IIC n=1 Tax=Ligilactobacillus sp. Marseille-Q7487 TaxID=3022128 RepID=UPI0015B621D7|nr:PTS transporter subunit EIIC [Ligilactobacillus sp. Marseille-Q7487]
MSNIMNKLQNGLDKLLGPFATFMGSNKYIKALTSGFLTTMPVTLGTAAIAILINLPIGPWTKLIQNIGLYQTGNDFISLTLSLIGIYLVGAIAYHYTKAENKNPIVGSVITLAVYIALMPLQYDKAGTASLLTSNMGSNGIFVGIICGLLVPTVYCSLMKKNLKLKLPSSVPPMVTESLEPTFVAMIIFTVVFFIKWILSLTSFNDAYQLITTIISKPIMNIGATPLALILVYSFENLCWFFGIHPATLQNCYTPVLAAVGVANTQAYLAGKPLPYLTFSVLMTAVYIGGNGNTLGICAASFFAKSEKYKAMRKLIIPANIFNINEPIIFGFPLMLNPIYFIPMVVTTAISGGVAWILASFLPINFNPTISLPWVTPGFISSFMCGGFWLFLIWLISFLLCFIIYLPFFMLDDARTYAEEQKNALE